MSPLWRTISCRKMAVSLSTAWMTFASVGMRRYAAMMPSSSALREDASKGRTGMCPWCVKGCVVWAMWSPYVEEERCVSWLRTDPSDAVYVRGDASRAVTVAGGREGRKAG